jgi:hypothetical protein
LEKACRLLPADRDLSDTMSMRFPRAPATEAAKTRLVELSPTWSTAPSGASSSAPTSSLRTGVPELANSRILLAVRAATPQLAGRPPAERPTRCPAAAVTRLEPPAILTLGPGGR